MSRRLTAVAAGLLTAASIATAPAAAASPQPSAVPATLTNLAHLDWRKSATEPSGSATAWLMACHPRIAISR